MNFKDLTTTDYTARSGTVVDPIGQLAYQNQKRKRESIERWSPKSFKQFKEEKTKEVVFTFGRFNPPTIGHEKLITKVAALAIGKDYRIFASQSQDSKKNPLQYKEKVQLMRKIFSKHGRNIILDSRIKNAIDALVYLYDQGYTKVTMVVGADRISDFKKLLNKYNGVDARHGFYNFPDGIYIESAGARDPDAEDVTGMSASKMRAAAAEGDFQSFANGLPKSFGDKLSVFNLLRKRMGLKEMTNFRKHIELEKTNVRERYVANEVFLEGDKFLTLQGDILTVTERCTNYIVGSDNNKYFLNKIVEVKQDKEIKDRKGSQPAKYFAKDADGDEMAKSTKQKRAAHFKKGASKDDDDPSAYEPAPGDASAETKPSKHTKKYKDMFGEETEVEEGVNDPAIFKAIFLAGGPGSGKSFTVGKTGLTALGFKIVNSDPAFEKAIEKAGGTKDAEFIFSPKGQEIRRLAKALTQKQMELYISGRLGLVIDGTGKDYTKIKVQAEKLKELGYDIGMIFVNTDLETAISRDAGRNRSLGAQGVTKMWKEVQKNIGKFQSFFKNNFMIVDNSEGSNFQKATIDAYKKFAKFAKEQPKNSIAKNWIKQQLGEESSKSMDVEMLKLLRKALSSTPGSNNQKNIIKKLNSLRTKAGWKEIPMSEDTKKGLEKKAQDTGIPYSILKQVFDRGVAAWRTGHRPGTTPTQWGYARVNSFATGGKTRTTADKDLWAKYKGKSESIEEELDPKADASTWIDDFAKSDAPQFKGKSKEERKQMALAAYYSAREKAGIK